MNWNNKETCSTAAAIAEYDSSEEYVNEGTVKSPGIYIN